MGAELRGDVTEFEAYELQEETGGGAPTAARPVVDITATTPVVDDTNATNAGEPAEAVVVDIARVEAPASPETNGHVEPNGHIATNGHIGLAPVSAGADDVAIPPGRLATAPRWKLAVKRAMDLVITIPVVALLSPVYVLAAVAVKATSRGPVFYSQDRVGKDGKTFRFYKFRSMRRTAEYEKPQLQELNEVNGPIFMMRKDPRVTRVGRVLRRLSIDELPQLFHVISGHMSLVGPRPHLPEEAAAYTERERRRLSVKPGITCIWQVSGRADIDFDQWIEMDLQYIDEWSLWLDVKLMVRTIPAVLTGRGAY